ncbi:MAG TPA: hybrid sensor histidine kinase/response regulator [Deltaproteobacteria bacterium]|jgi:signal transduction histidine kinase|nr:hybrid sensor histidine kinase/response regulator [Deltaproteobacteria bacterium]HOI08346.1 hybrid sensor histidine kinase/response regulator [Deltaproteobacteria bacterium]
MAEGNVPFHILVIDDEESILDGCRQTLEKSGYSVTTTPDGADGVRLAREVRPEVAFVDLKMPNCSGMDIIELLSKDLPDIVLIVITGYASIVSAVEAMKKGAYDYLPKPFSPDQIRAVTKRGIEHRELKIEANRLREEKERMEKNFITFVSHEMRSPLVTIQQYIESLKLITGNTLTGDAAEILGRCEKRITSLQDLIEHWLDLSRIENGTFSEAKSPLDLTEVLRKSIEEMSPVCQRREINLCFESREELPKVLGDHESLLRVFSNVIGNATKYTPPAGVISVKASHDDYYVYVSVSDTGQGIPQDKLPFIFEPFYRVRGKEERQKGSGLGLTFVKKIMEAHDGRIVASSKEGEGSTFTMKFPRLYEL